MSSSRNHSRSVPDEYADRMFWALCALTLLVCAWGTWSIPVLSTNEARRMVIVQEMTSNSEWLIPTMNGQLYVTKPPLYPWLAALFAALFQSTAEGVLRLPSVLSAMAVAGLLYRRVAASAGRTAALLSLFILVTCPLFVQHARRAEIEMLLAATCTAGLIFFLDYLKSGKQGPLYLAYLFVGLATLTKGPVALVFFLPPLLVFGAVYREPRVYQGLRSAGGWVLYLVVALSWFLYVYLKLGSGPFAAVIEEDIAGKVVDTVRGDPFYSYFLKVLGFFLPWWLFLVFNRPDRLGREVLRVREAGFFGLSVLVPLVVMSLFSKKQDKYILPFFPAMAAFLGIWMAAIQARLSEKYGARVPRLLFRVVLVLCLACFVYFQFLEKRVFSHRFTGVPSFAARVRDAAKETPVFSYGRDFMELVYYYGSPLPLVNEKEMDQMLGEKASFWVVAESPLQAPLVARGFCLKDSQQPFIKKKREVNLFASPLLCQGDIHPPKEETGR